jgi:type I restriction enzyme M protein
MLTQEIRSRINWLWDRFWAGGLANPITAIEQISYLLFIHRLEQVEKGKLIPSKDLRWSYFSKEIPDQDELLAHFKRKVFPFIKTLKNEHEPFSLLMQDASFDIDKASLLREAIDVIYDIYREIEKQKELGQHFQDTQGDVYEYLLNATKQAGKNGQFRTPRHIIQLMCEIVDPKIGDKICDVTCGTSGFLIGAYQHILTKFSSSKFIMTDENGLKRGISGDKLSKLQSKNLRTNTFFGFDNDKTMVRIGLMNLIMHGITEPQIVKLDTLSKAYDVYENSKASSATQMASRPKKAENIDEKYSVILANPPFTGRIDKNGLSTKLNRTGTSKSEILFLDRIVHMLTPEGKAAVIVPEGVLFGSLAASKKIREILLKDCALDAVISLPTGVFLPYTAVKTSILVFTKKKLFSDVFNTNRVWFYGMDSDGYSLDTNRKRLNDFPLPEVVKQWNISEKHRQDKSRNHFYVSIDDILDNGLDLSFNTYSDYAYQEQSYEPPTKLIAELVKLEDEIMRELTKINRLLQ